MTTLQHARHGTLTHTGRMISNDLEQGGMRIGELAQRTGVSARSLRYYEQCGLLSSHRDQNGYRRYDNDAVHLVVNLRRLLGAGLSVADIQQFGSLRHEPRPGFVPLCAGSCGLRAATPRPR